VAVLPRLRRLGVLFPLLLGAYGAVTLLDLARLHPLEYVAINRLAGGMANASGRFELDYSSVAATEAIRVLSHRLRLESHSGSNGPVRVMVCIPWREWAVSPLLPAGWVMEIRLESADYVIETERWRCASDGRFRLIEMVTRAGLAFAWIHAKANSIQR
jgi:hypothetical protein